MNIVWRPMAIADRERIFDYIAQDNPLAALQLDEEFTLFSAVDRLQVGASVDLARV